MLRFQAEPAAVGIDLSAFAGARSLHLVACIELHPRLGCQHLQHSSADRFGDARRQPQRARRTIENEIVIVAAAYADLLIVGVDARADGSGLAEVEGVPVTSRTSPVTISAPSIGVNAFASIMATWSWMLPCPARLK